MSKENLIKAILAVMGEVKNIEKSMKVGEGNYSYSGVPDSEVKRIVGDSMQRNGLCILPVGIKSKTEVSRWEETNKWGVKQKQSVFTEVDTEYLLMHESGESQRITGYGHGVDSQDKSAGMATTYALKYTLLYTFLVPTTKMDDSDKTHSNDIAAPPSRTEDKRPFLNKNTTQWTEAIKYLKGSGSIAVIEKKYRISNEDREELLTSSM